MATDAMESMGQTLKVGNNFYVSIEAESKEEAGKREPASVILPEHI